MKLSLPSLSDRGTRVRLLAWSYLDAVEGKAGAGGTHGKPTSCIPSRNGELWDRGSYKQLEQAMDALRQSDRMLAGIFEKLHVHPRHWLDSDERASVHAIVALMPQKVYVPASITLATAYTVADARAWSYRWDSDEELGKPLLTGAHPWAGDATGALHG